MNPKITILTPSYNDQDTILLTIESVLNQSYINFEWIIVNDGSTDDTSTILNNIDDPRVFVIHKKNGDQLEALEWSIKSITGDYVMLLHSDDLLFNNDSILNLVKCCDDNPEGLFSDYIKINKLGNEIGRIINSKLSGNALIHKIILSMGSNLKGDHFFARRDIFMSNILSNYILKNKIYYINYESTTALNLKYTKPWYKYRIYDENYINNDTGKIVTLLGQFRTVTSLLSYGNVPRINILFGYNFFRLLRRFNIYIDLPIITKRYASAQFLKYWRNDLSRYNYPIILEKIIDKIRQSYENRFDYKTPYFLRIEDDSFDPYTLAQGRKFASDLASGELHSIYKDFINFDFDHIIVHNGRDYKVGLILNEFFSTNFPVRMVKKD